MPSTVCIDLHASKKGGSGWNRPLCWHGCEQYADESRVSQLGKRAPRNIGETCRRRRCSKKNTESD